MAICPAQPCLVFYARDAVRRKGREILHQWDKPGNKGWRVAKGNPVLNIIWLERKRTSNHLVFKPGKPQTILMRQVLLQVLDE